MVKKIKKTTSGWNLYPKNDKESPIFISKENYSGKMPPFFRWPGQELELKLTLVADFQISASLNGHTLFEIPKEDYPSAVKKLLEKGEELNRRAAANAKERDDAVKKALKDYLKDIPLNPNFEDELSALRLCLRVYIKLHLFKGSLGEERMQRLNLMMLICKMVQRIYSRHVNEEMPLGIASASFQYCLTYNFPHYADRVEHYEQFSQQPGSDKVFELYYEVDRLMEDTLPPVKDDSLKRYLNYLTREVLKFFADDMACLDRNHLCDAWNRRMYSDEGDYRQIYKKMELLKYESFVLPEVFTDKVIGDFILEYNLK